MNEDKMLLTKSIGEVEFIHLSLASRQSLSVSLNQCLQRLAQLQGKREYRRGSVSEKKQMTDHSIE